MSLKGLGVFGVLGQGLPSSGFDTSNLEPFICRVRIVRSRDFGFRVIEVGFRGATCMLIFIHNHRAGATGLATATRPAEINSGTKTSCESELLQQATLLTEPVYLIRK